MKFSSFILLLIAASAVANIKPGKNTTRPVTWYDCMAKEVGHYLHPYDCTRFIVCDAAFRAIEFDCPDCTHKPEICTPLGRLIYNATLNQCMGENETGCRLA